MVTVTPLHHEFTISNLSVGDLGGSEFVQFALNLSTLVMIIDDWSCHGTGSLATDYEDAARVTGYLMISTYGKLNPHHVTLRTL
jgi:hypothetical protein